MSLRRDNHFVPRSYLKRWAHADGKVWSYRLLVPHGNVLEWKNHSISGIAYQQYLYTAVRGGVVTDEFEKWLDREIEAPAESALEKVFQSQRLARDDWRRLLRLTAAQDARTPARYLEDTARWKKDLDGWMQDTLEKTIHDLEKKGLRKARERVPDRNAADFPFKVSVERNPDAPGGWVKAETVIGRSMWIASIRQRSTSTWHELLKHRWTIMEAPHGISWLTSDDPVIRLNFNSLTDYNFGGGYGRKSSEFIFPLSPKHLLYTQIGRRLPPNTQVDRQTALRIQEMIVRHAHRRIFALAPDVSVPAARPRLIDATMFASEAAEWRGWHTEQTDAEIELGL